MKTRRPTKIKKARLRLQALPGSTGDTTKGKPQNSGNSQPDLRWTIPHNYEDGVTISVDGRGFLILSQERLMELPSQVDLSPREATALLELLPSVLARSRMHGKGAY